MRAPLVSKALMPFSSVH